MPTTYSDQDIEAAKDILITSDIGYWVKEARILDDGALYLVEDDDEAEPVRISPIRLLSWLEGPEPHKLIADLGDDYHKHAVALMTTRNWADLDYDIITADVIVQWIALGEIRYG